jgi:hypothetical protein
VIGFKRSAREKGRGKGKERKRKERKNISKRTRIDCMMQQAYPFPNVTGLLFDIPNK